MTDSAWKVVMDQNSVTISGDQFVLTTTGSDPGRLDTVVSQLQGVARTPYGQYCGLTRAIEMIGERWGVLIVRDLMTNPKSEAELRRGLPSIPERLLTMRLREMIYSGVIRERAGSGAQTRYELTEYGRAAEDALLALGRWGAIAPGAPRPEDVVTEDSLMVALRSAFLPDRARTAELSFELRVADVVVHATVVRGRLDLYRGATSDVDLVIEAGLSLKSLMTGELGVREALETGEVSVTGAPELLSTFVEMFHLPTLPSAAPA
jgi:DNA-binding HxlR family transcriptional regulator